MPLTWWQLAAVILLIGGVVVLDLLAGPEDR
jgi:hypothetical protein